MASDGKIIGRVLKGHREEYRELMRRPQDCVFRLACRILGRREEAEDVVQEAFVKAYSNLAGCREREQVRRVDKADCSQYLLEADSSRTALRNGG